MDVGRVVTNNQCINISRYIACDKRINMWHSISIHFRNIKKFHYSGEQIKSYIQINLVIFYLKRKHFYMPTCIFSPVTKEKVETRQNAPVCHFEASILKILQTPGALLPEDHCIIAIYKNKFQLFKFQHVSRYIRNNIIHDGSVSLQPNLLGSFRSMVF